MKLVLALVFCAGLVTVHAVPAAVARPARKAVTNAGEDPDPEIEARRQFVKQVRRIFNINITNYNTYR